MCGISGWQLSQQNAPKFAAHSDTLINALEHRGPDAKGEYQNEDKSLWLGHNRLSIIDLSALGNQPMKNDSGDVMVLNGEIYNYRSLRKELIGLGHQFVSESDSEVVIKGFQQWGIGVTDKIVGMYALAIWSEREQTLHLMRDPTGMKPLYYWQLPNQGGVVFASELQAFTTLPGFSKSVDRTSLSQYLEFGYCFEDQHTIFSNVSKLSAGHRVEIKDAQIHSIQAFYQPPKTLLTSPSIADTEERLYTALQKVVQEHFVADVPVGLLLSGGLDSSLIGAIASQQQQIHTFSMGFADSFLDERKFARMVSDHIGSTHKEILIEPSELMHGLESTAAHYDDLFGDWGMVSTRLLYKKCQQQGVKVVLVGEGADELFGGYGSFQHALNQRAPMEWKLFQLYRAYAGRRYGKQYKNFRRVMLKHLETSNGDLFSAVRLFESRNQLPNNFVMKVDKASMSLSLEARAPFLDMRIANIAYQLPQQLLIDANTEKKILKSMAARYNLLPAEIVQRRKYGTGVASNWMEDSVQFRQYAQDIILQQDSWVDDLGLRDAMQRYFHEGQAGYRFPKSISLFRHLAWKLLILNLWGSALGVKP